MTSIYKYQKFIDSIRTVELKFPHDENLQRLGQELATIENVTYVCVDSELPEQPVEISDTVELVTVTADIKKAISEVSPHIQLINENVKNKIREKYHLEDEIKLLRTAPSTEFDVYNAYVEECRAWGKAEKAKLGL